MNIYLMDPTNCTAGIVTDRLFMRTPIGTCNSSIVGFEVFFGVVLILRFSAAFLRYRRHLQRKKRRLLTSPISPILSFLTVFLQALFFSLAMRNVITVDNGLSFSVFSLVFLSFGCQYIIELYRLVRLGSRIGTFHLNDRQSSSALESFDRLGLILVFFSGISVIVITVTLVFLSPSYPQYDILLGTIGFASKGVFQGLVTFAIVWQMRRCMIVIRQKMPDSILKTKALRKLCYGMMSYSTFGLFTATFFLLLAAQVFPWYWYLVLGLTGGIETIGHVLLEIRRSVHLIPNSSAMHYTTNNNNKYEKNNPISRTDMQRRFPLGIKSKFRRPTFRTKLSRVTEVSEFRTNQEQNTSTPELEIKAAIHE